MTILMTPTTTTIKLCRDGWPFWKKAALVLHVVDIHGDSEVQQQRIRTDINISNSNVNYNVLDCAVDDLQEEVVHDDVVADGDDVGVALLPLSLPPSPPRHGEGVSPDHVIDLPFCWSQDEVHHHHGDHVHFRASLSCSRTSSFFFSFSSACWSVPPVMWHLHH